MGLTIPTLKSQKAYYKTTLPRPSATQSKHYKTSPIKFKQSTYYGLSLFYQAQVENKKYNRSELDRVYLYV